MARTMPTAPAADTPPASGSRLMSVDVLRGFDMFWIVGANAIVYALNHMVQTPVVQFFARQLDHADWQGFRFYDLIFPLFVFLVGVSLVFSLTKLVEKSGRATALQRIFRRAALLFLIGIFYSGGFTNAWPEMRLLGVLNRIALAYLFAGLLFACFRPRALVGICAGLLTGYWALMTFVPIRDIQLDKARLAVLAEQAGDAETAAYYRNPDSRNPSAVRNSPVWAETQRLFEETTNHVSGKFEPGLNLANHLDFQYLPGMKYDNFYDPEGLLSTIPAVATCLLGVFAGLLLRNSSVRDRQKVAILIGAGAIAAASGWLWGLQFPVIKKIWTSSYVLVAGGYSSILLGLFFLVVDVWQKRAWCQPFVWMGMNSITIYLAANILGSFRKVGIRFAGGDVKAFFDNHVAAGAGDMVIAIVGLLLAFWFVRFLYRRQIFLRL
jgi:predicted acyltransferase